MDSEQENFRPTIREWAKDDRPRERLMAQGPQALSDAELLAILIRTGTPKMNALEMGREILRAGGNDLGRLGRMSVADLMKTHGMGEAKAITIAAALELGRRRREQAGPERRMIASSKDAYEELRPVMADLANEQFWLLILDRGNRITDKCMVSDGGMHGTVADPKRIFKEALDRRAASIVLSHNHPSGQLRPSSEDIALTKKLVEGARLLDITVQDHLIVTETGYFSFADNGML
ncbi:MAG: DNA repair protein RadC [Flavobacteriales bacterium]|nr:DNA repair protein RadC [Flavobacteriales bacterium]MBK7556685.1 DNA repair protein RadC [Flavobacteriales bacterium]